MEDDSIQRQGVFLSYSHKDKKFLDQLLTHLKPLERAGLVTYWSDLQIAAGSPWFQEIGKALASARAGVLLVTSDFLASDFIHEKELGPLLKEAEQGGVRILWIPVRACSYKVTPLPLPLGERGARFSIFSGDLNPVGSRVCSTPRGKNLTR